jgi:hypothetical protein
MRVFAFFKQFVKKFQFSSDPLEKYFVQYVLHLSLFGSNLVGDDNILDNFISCWILEAVIISQPKWSARDQPSLKSLPFWELSVSQYFHLGKSHFAVAVPGSSVRCRLRQMHPRVPSEYSSRESLRVQLQSQLPRVCQVLVGVHRFPIELYSHTEFFHGDYDTLSWFQHCLDANFGKNKTIWDQRRLNEAFVKLGDNRVCYLWYRFPLVYINSKRLRPKLQQKCWQESNRIANDRS